MGPAVSVPRERSERGSRDLGGPALESSVPCGKAWGSQKTNTVAATEQPPKASCLEHVGVTRRLRGCARGRQSGAPVAALTSATGMWTSDADTDRHGLPLSQPCPPGLVRSIPPLP